MPLGGGVGSLLCAVLLVICFSTTGVDGLHGQFLGILLMLLAGGCLGYSENMRISPKKKKR